jgi:hypothetical protein
MDQLTLRDWVHRYNQLGVAGLCSVRTEGLTAVLTAAQMAELRELTIKGPDPERTKSCGGAASIFARKCCSDSKSLSRSERSENGCAKWT